MALDSSGNIWVASSAQGVSQFNGTSWKAYKKADGLINNYTSDIQIDPKGRVQITTGGEISIFDKGSWSYYTKEKDGLKYDVRTITFTDNNEVWLTYNTYQYLKRDSEKQFGLAHFKNGKWYHYGKKDGLVDNHPLGLFYSSKGELWVGMGGIHTKTHGITVIPLGNSPIE